MQCITLEQLIMSFDFNSNINPINKAQPTYKDGGGLGGGGMYMKQGKKSKKQPEDDMFEYSESKDTNEINLVQEPEIKEEDIPDTALFNRFVNWFRIGKD